MNGVLILDKPAGLTSHDVVARLRRILKTKKIGHTGTLDPFATGVLVMLVGKATRLARFLDQDEKSYEALIRFGFATDTGDRTGTPISDPGCGVSDLSDILQGIEWENVLDQFRGETEQIPPMYSAKKVKGKKLYELARRGIEIERKPVKVNISELELINNSQSRTPNLRSIRVSCTAGTYIRTLAEDIGRQIGVPCHLAELRRTKAGSFEIDRAVTLEELERSVEAGELDRILISMSDAVAHLPAVILNEDEIERTKNGIRYHFYQEDLPDEAEIRMISRNGELIAIGFCNRKEKFIQPRIVMV